MKRFRILAAAALALCAIAGDAAAQVAYTDTDPATGARITRAVKPGFGLPVTQSFGPSGVTPVTCALTSTTTCGPITPIAGRDFNISGWGTFVAGYQVERSFDNGTTWLPLTAAGTQLYVWTAPASESASESEYGVQYRVRVTSYTSGTLNVRLSQ